MAKRYLAKRTRVSRSSAEWRSLMEAYEASGLSKSAFCREHGVAPSSMNKALQRVCGTGRSELAAPAFVAVSVPAEPAASTPSWDVELQLSAETVIRLRIG